MKITAITSALLAVLLLAAISAHAADTNQERDFEIALTKGQYAIELGDYGAAIAQLTKALELKPGDQAAQVSLGIAYARSGDLAKADETLAQAVQKDPNNARARYERALVLEKLGKKEDARAEMTEVLKSTDEELRAAAQGFLAEGPREKKKDYALGISGGFQYDSNVILEPDNPVGAGAKQSDWRALLALDAAYVPLRTERFNAEAGYHFYQSLHNDLTDFNVQQHALRAQAGYDLSKNSHLGLKYEFLYAFVGGDHYSTTHQTTASLSSNLTAQSLSELHAAYASRRYFDSDVFIGLTDRNGSNTAGGLSHTMMIGTNAAVALDYTWDKDSTAVDGWSYTGNKGTVNALINAGSAYRFFLSASYYDRKYDALLAGASEIRHDGVQEYVAGVTRKMSGNLGISLTEDYIINDSNLSFYQYTRNIVGILAEWKL